MHVFVGYFNCIDHHDVLWLFGLLQPLVILNFVVLVLLPEFGVGIALSVFKLLYFHVLLHPLHFVANIEAVQVADVGVSS